MPKIRMTFTVDFETEWAHDEATDEDTIENTSIQDVLRSMDNKDLELEVRKIFQQTCTVRLSSVRTVQ